MMVLVLILNLLICKHHWVFLNLKALMKELKLKSDEIGWIKYCLIRIASNNSFITKKEEKFLWKLLKKIEKQESKKDDI